MSTGAFGENFPYSNFHDLNMDWIIKIAKDFLDQYNTIQTIISDGEESLQSVTNQGLEELATLKTHLEELLQEWYNTHSNDITTQLADALADIDRKLTIDIQAFNAAAEEKAAETIASIPSDYTTLANQVALNTDNIEDIVNLQNISLFRETFTATTVNRIYGLNIANGMYKLHVDNVTSEDTDATVCRVMFLYDDYLVYEIFLSRNTSTDIEIPLAGSVNNIQFLASDSYAHGTGDSFTITGFTIYKDTPLHDKLNYSYTGLQKLLNGEDIIVFNKTITSTGRLDVPCVLPKGKYVFRADSISSTDTDNTVCRVMFINKDSQTLAQFYADRVNNYQTTFTINGQIDYISFFASDGAGTSAGDTFQFANCTITVDSVLDEFIEIPTSPANLIQNIKKYNGTGATLLLDNATFDIVSIYKAYFGNNYFDNYTGYVGSTNPFDRGLFVEGIKIKGRTNTKIVFPSDTGNADVRRLFSVFAPYTGATLENLTIDIGNGFCRYAIHDDYAPQNCIMHYKNLVLKGTGTADALYGMGCGSNATYIFDHCWFISGSTRAFVAHSAPNQTQPCIVKLNGCVSDKEIAFFYYSTFSGMNLAYVDANLSDVTINAVQAGDTENFTVYHDTGNTIEVLTH